MIEEVWKDIEGYEGLYQISNTGKVKSLGRKGVDRIGRKYSFPEKVIKFTIGTSGYPTTHLVSEDSIRETIMIHRIVAKTFIPNHENKHDVNHIDGNKQNNLLSNLEWMTRSENINHSYKIGTHKKGLNHHQAGITKEMLIDIILNHKKYDKHFGIRCFAKKYNVDEDTINKYLKIYKIEDLVDD